MKLQNNPALLSIFCLFPFLCCSLPSGLPAQDASVKTDEAPAKIESAYLIKPPFAWNRADRYDPPNANAFFPDDVQGGKELTFCIQGKNPWPKDVDERLALVRRGLRQMSGHKTLLIGKLGNEFVWNRDPQDARAIELLYHASDLRDAETSHYAFYHGPAVVSQRTPNLLRALMEQYQERGTADQHRIAWGMKTYGDKELTRELLLKFLDGYETADESAICAAIDTYKAVFDTPPPDMQRFDRTGKWVVAFHRTDLSAGHPRAAQILREQTDKWLRGRPGTLLDFVTRVDDGHETAVVLVQGNAARQDLLTLAKPYIFVRADFDFLLSPRVLREYRLREFARHLPRGLPDKAKPEYSRPDPNETYAFNADTYVPPDYETFFADDEEAGKQLGDVFEKLDQSQLNDRELLQLVRQGLRRSTKPPNSVIGSLAYALGWPADPLLKEIMYHAIDVRAPFPIRDVGVYYGYNLNEPKTRNMLEALFQAYMAPPYDRTTDGNFRSRILWSVRDHEDHKHYLATQFGKALQNHAELSSDQVRLANQAYQQLTSEFPPNGQEYGDRIVQLVGFTIPNAYVDQVAQTMIEMRLGNPDFWLDAEYTKQDANIQVMAVIRGHNSIQLLADQLQKKPQWPITFAMQFNHEFWKESKDKLPSRFENYLPEKK